jgi:hypothetical protein
LDRARGGIRCERVKHRQKNGDRGKKRDACSGNAVYAAVHQNIPSQIARYSLL